MGDIDDDGSRRPHPDVDLVRIAATLRRVMPRVDEEARERLEAAWVALVNAVKQPKSDAAMLMRRFRRLRDELDDLVGRGDDPPDAGAVS